jgi:zinc protease
VRVLPFLIALVFGEMTASAASSPDPSKLSYAALPEFRMPDYSRVELGNGLVVYLLHDPAATVIRVTAMIRGGDRDDPVGKEGFAQALAAALSAGRASAAGNTNGIELIGASLEIAAEADVLRLEGEALPENTESLLMFIAQLHSLQVGDKEVATAVQTVRNHLAGQRKIARNAFIDSIERVLCGNSPDCVRRPTDKSLRGITAEDILDACRTRLIPSNTIVVVSAGMDREALAQTVAKTLGAWKGPAAPASTQARANETHPPVRVGETYFLQWRGLKQSWVAFARPGIQYDDPEYAAVAVADRILGNGPDARLHTKIRSEMGLSYLAGSHFQPGYRRAGILALAAGTQPSEAVHVLTIMKNLLQAFADGAISEQDVDRARESLINRVPFDYAYSRRLTDRLLLPEIYAFPIDVFAQYEKRLRGITLSDVKRAAKRWFDPAQYSAFILGDGSSMDLGNLEHNLPLIRRDIQSTDY